MNMFIRNYILVAHAVNLAVSYIHSYLFYINIINP